MTNNSDSNRNGSHGPGLAVERRACAPLVEPSASSMRNGAAALADEELAAGLIGSGAGDHGGAPVDEGVFRQKLRSVEIGGEVSAGDLVELGVVVEAVRERLAGKVAGGPAGGAQEIAQGSFH